MIELSLRRRQGRVSLLIDRELYVTLYRLERMCHKPALTTELVAELRGVGLKKVDCRLTISPRGSNHMIYAAGVVGGVPDRCRGISLSVVVGVSSYAEERVQEVLRHAIDWCVSGSRMRCLADANAEEAIEPIVLVNTQESDEYDLDQTPGGGRSE